MQTNSSVVFPTAFSAMTMSASGKGAQRATWLVGGTANVRGRSPSALGTKGTATTPGQSVPGPCGGPCVDTICMCRRLFVNKCDFPLHVPFSRMSQPYPDKSRLFLHVSMTHSFCFSFVTKDGVRCCVERPSHWTGLLCSCVCQPLSECVHSCLLVFLQKVSHYSVSGTWIQAATVCGLVCQTWGKLCLIRSTLGMPLCCWTKVDGEQCYQLKNS